MATAVVQNKPDCFLWQGTNKQGNKVKGEMQSPTAALVKSELRRQGITPLKVRKKPKPLFSFKKKKISAQDIAFFSRQLTTLIAAGVPLTQSLDIIARGVDNPSMQDMVNSLLASVADGNSLADSFAQFPKQFNELYVNLVQAGEQSGSLEKMLDKIASYREKIEKIKGKIKKSMFYPCSVIIIAFLITAGILVFIVPQFENLFKSFGAELPLFTRMLLRASEYFQSYWWLVFAAIIALILGFRYAYTSSQRFVYFVDRSLLKLPIFGEILRKAVIARFARTLSTTFAAGLPLVEAITAVSGAVGNVIYRDALLRVRDEVETGHRLQIALRNTSLFPNFVMQLVGIGEESGSLENMLDKVAEFYEQYVDDAVDGLSSLIEPLIMLVLGVLIGSVVIALYMPIFKLGSVI